MENKAKDMCPRCKYCLGMTPQGMYSCGKANDSDVCCSMFEVRKEKEPFNLNMPREAIKAIAKLNNIISELEKEKAAHLKGIERLKKTQEKLQNQVKNLQTINEESYKREEKLEEKFKEANEVADSWQRDYERLRDQFVHPIYNILYPDKPVLNTSFDINVTDLLNDVKNLKVYGDENGRMYKEIQEWREKCIARGEELNYWEENCHKAETDVTTLNSKVETLKNKNTKLNQTISDQEITIKALLITIKEMCKEDETNE